MIDIVTPQRFYQFDIKNKNNNLQTVIDLKVIIQILLDKNACYDKDILVINTNAPQPPITIDIDKNEVAEEMYSKLVTAWTTYKLATER